MPGMTHAAWSHIFQALEVLFVAQGQEVAAWHRDEPEALASTLPDELEDLAQRLHLANFKLWHLEDSARRTDIRADAVADCKRAIDRMNQSRNDAIEQLDACLERLITTLLPAKTPDRYNTETMGAAVDRLSISALKIYHMAIEAEREDADVAHRDRCRLKLEQLEAQRSDLEKSVLELLEEYRQGRKRPKVFRQFKMYNDPDTNPELYGTTRRRKAHGQL